jgi:hypothetical protein
MKKNIDIVRDYLNDERPFTKVGYTGDADKYVVRSDGDTWEDSSGKQWIQKNGTAQSVTRVLDIVRAEINDKCFKCDREIRWGTKHDSKMHAKTGMCFDCLVEEETLMRAQGKFKEYERKKMFSNELAHLKSVKKHIQDSKEYLKDHREFTFVNSNGMVEKWDNHAFEDLKKSLKKDFVRCLKEIRRVEAELKTVSDGFEAKSSN